ncbi:MAG: Nramp family divalent metal transporter [Candidatus Eremiobacteraeota bacterium]|nr:Nramp family divalent metal transporter [Candidatus Eremiobacteraeota bacterium]MCW5867162.1 Nramp family divalent metal transporter [Candidatus Eremiobacteraeota bacterium]
MTERTPALEGLEPLERIDNRATEDALRAASGSQIRLQGRSYPAGRIPQPKAAWLRWLAILGPGLVAASAGNDAGGIATYSSAGAKYGYDLIWVMVLITVPMALIQETCARLGAATGRGLLDLIRHRFGCNWALFAIVVVGIANAGLIVSEFVGLGAAGDLLGIPKLVLVPLAAIALWALVLFWSYSYLEKVLILMTLVFLVYPAAAWMGQPHAGELARGAFIPHLKSDRGFLMLLVALIGTTITPYMQLFQQSSMVERLASRKNYGNERWDAWVGCTLSNLMSIAMMVATAATLHKLGKTTIDSAADAAKALEPAAGHAATTLFAVGLLGATLLAAAVLPLATAYAVTEAMGAPKGVDLDFRRAPLFFGLFTFLLVLGAGVALIPRLPVMDLLVGVQVLNGVLLPFVLVFIVLLANDKRYMGELKNTRLTNIFSVITIVTITTAVLILLGDQFFGG